ncbi:MAG: hypothetical protein K1X48_05325 [Burkholderiaceae bacterium]|nr:hypothetical protein [Burkholderiaceae bacterium]
MLDLQHALEYLHGDQVLLQQILKLFTQTLSQLQAELKTAQCTSNVQVNDSEWQTFYRTLHGAKPVLLIVGNSTIRKIVPELCEALVTKNHIKALELAPLFGEHLQKIALEITVQNNAAATPASSG